MSRGVWKTVETGVGEVRMGETERERNERGSGEEERRKGKEEKTEKGENSGS